MERLFLSKNLAPFHNGIINKILMKREPKVYVLHENEAWVKPLFQSFKELGVPFENWFINSGKLNLSDVPPEGVFYNRMSASSHTREHRYAVEFSESILSWLELHQRKVVNGRQALTLEVRKIEQQLLLNKFGIKTPNTIVTNNPSDLVSAAKELNQFPFIIKPNRGGKGLGVKRYENIYQLESDVENGTVPESLDGMLLVQEFVESLDGRITRLEFIGGQFYYAVSIDSSKGFELCPADSCNIGDAFCPANKEEASLPDAVKFKVLDEFQVPHERRFLDFLNHAGISIGAIEFILDKYGKPVVYDVNTNTNYNSEAEMALGNKYRGMRKIAEYLKGELELLRILEISERELV